VTVLQLTERQIQLSLPPFSLMTLVAGPDILQ